MGTATKLSFGFGMDSRTHSGARVELTHLTPVNPKAINVPCVRARAHVSATCHVCLSQSLLRKAVSPKHESNAQVQCVAIRALGPSRTHHMPLFFDFLFVFFSLLPAPPLYLLRARARPPPSAARFFSPVSPSTDSGV